MVLSYERKIYTDEVVGGGEWKWKENISNKYSLM